MSFQLVPQCRLLNESEVAQILHVEVSTIRRWRWSGDGPPFVKLKGAVRYEPVSVEKYIEVRRKISSRRAVAT